MALLSFCYVQRMVLFQIIPSSSFFRVYEFNLRVCGWIFVATCPPALVDSAPLYSWRLHCCVRVSIICSNLCLADSQAYRFSSTARFIRRFTIFHLILFAVLEIRAAAAAAAAVTIFCSLLWFNTRYVYRLRFLYPRQLLAFFFSAHTVINITQTYGFQIASVFSIFHVTWSFGWREMRITKHKTNIDSVLFISPLDVSLSSHFHFLSVFHCLRLSSFQNSNSTRNCEWKEKAPCMFQI